MTGFLLINVGTPEAPTPKALRRYLSQFLSDPGVIDLHPLLRWLLVHLVIVPFRAPKSAALYQKIWTPEGSPLLVHLLKLARAVETRFFPLPRGEEQAGKLVPEGTRQTARCSLAREAQQSLLGGRVANYAIELGMRYGNPSIHSALEKLLKSGAEKIRLLPLFPQYSFSTTRSVVEETERSARSLRINDRLEILPPFYNHPGFIRSFAEVGRPFLAADTDHILFSFHGLPEKQIAKGDPYKEQCYRTAGLLGTEMSHS